MIVEAFSALTTCHHGDTRGRCPMVAPRPRQPHGRFRWRSRLHIAS